MALKIALAGNPNSGKTSVFNSITGAMQKVGNWGGVTVEIKEGTKIIDGEKVTFIDLPGTYSLSAFSEEERVARDYLVDNKPDVVIDVVDGTNLDRHLYLAVQLMELGIRPVIALNMWDEVTK
ncbi:MAG: ferrous iron transport protein B, partial [Chitinivibrionales bacterium]|nr:ferrous iron transport protein B [Chitinivibrionales bacterium]